MKGRSILKANKIVTNALKFGILLLGLFYLLFSAQKSFAITVGGGGGQSPGESSGGSGSGNSNEGYGRAVWVYYRINNTTQGVAIGDSYPNDPWGTSFSLPANECGPYGGFWVLQLTSNGASNKAYTASTVVSAVPAQYRWSRENYPLQRPVGGIDNLTVVSPQRLMFDETDYEFKYGLVQTYNETYSSLDKDMNYKTQQGWYVNGLNWDEVMELFKSKNGGSTGGCSAINNGAGDDCWNNSYSRMKYFCYGDDPVQTATFGGSATISSVSGLSRSDSYFTGNGRDTDYSVTVTYNVTRTNSEPTYATSQYSYTNASSSATTPSLSNGQTHSKTVTYSVHIDNGVSNQYTCFSITYDSSVDYLGSDRTVKGRNSASVCGYFSNPAKNTANFSGSITASASAGLTLDSNTYGESRTAQGNGLKNTFTITPTYTVTRSSSDGNPANAISYYDVSTSGYPSSRGKNTGAITRGTTHTYNGGGSNVSINIDGSPVTRCFYLSYDSAVRYYGSTYDGVISTSNKRMCFTITNPSRRYTSHFTGETSAGYLDQHERLTRTNNNTVGVIDHSKRITGSSTNPIENGSFNEDSYPGNSQYTATFVHKLTRTDSEISDKVNNFYVGSAAVSWQIQYSLNGGDYQDYSRTDDKNSSATTGATDTLSAQSSKSITVNPKWTLDYSNRGKYIYYCQRIRYTETSTYKSVSSGNSYSASLVSYGSNKYTSPLCVTLRNPQWDETRGQDLIHNISIKGRTTDSKNKVSAVYADGATLRGNKFYETTATVANFGFPHMLWREDSGFDESQIGASVFEPSVSKAFFQPSIYNHPDYKVSTKMYGNESLPDSRPNIKLIWPVRANSMVDGYAVSLNSSGLTDTSTNYWFSTQSDGQTSTVFHADTGSGANREYVLLAGQSKRFSQSTYNINGANWQVRYRHVSRCEVYTSGYRTGLYGDCKYDRTEIVDYCTTFNTVNGTDTCTNHNLYAPVEVSPVYYDSRDNEEYTVFRPYNYTITDASPTETPTSDDTYNGQKINRTFDITINRENSSRSYITDVYNPTVYVIGFRILPGQDRSKIQNATVGGTVANSGNAQGDICTSFYGADSQLGFHSNGQMCQILSTTTLGTKDNNNDYNHVYGPTSGSGNYKYEYKLGVSTGDVVVPRDLEIGEKYCVAVAISNYQSKHDNQNVNDYIVNRYLISHATCSNIAKLPSLQVWSGSVQTNGGVRTSTSESRDQDDAYLTFGSWADFAVIANGTSAKMASGASIAQGIAYQDTSSILCHSSPLTIANSQCENNNKPDALGSSGVVIENLTIDKLISRYQSESADVTLIETDKIESRTFTDKNLNPNAFFSTQPIVIYSQSDLLIKSNIISDSTRVLSANYVPEIIIISRGNIKIDQSVTRLDAWIVADGYIDTCTDGINTITLSNSVCREQLNVHGVLLGSKVMFKRTFGGDANKNTANIPAEIINFTGNTLLFTAREAEKHQLPETTYLRKLPPRY